MLGMLWSVVPGPDWYPDNDIGDIQYKPELCRPEDVRQRSNGSVFMT